MNYKVDLNLYNFFSTFLSMVFFATNVFPQNLPEIAYISENSISMSGGLGRLTIRYQAVSNESYSRSLCFNLKEVLQYGDLFQIAFCLKQSALCQQFRFSPIFEKGLLP